MRSDDGRSVARSRVIAYFDVDCFYAQCEELRAGDRLRGKAVGITQKFLVVTCNYPARAMGITKLMSVSEAKKRAAAAKGELHLVPGEDLTPFRDASDTMWTELRRAAEEDAAVSSAATPVERGGLDEFVVDITGLAQAELQRVDLHSRAGCKFTRAWDRCRLGLLAFFLQ